MFLFNVIGVTQNNTLILHFMLPAAKQPLNFNGVLHFDMQMNRLFLQLINFYFNDVLLEKETRMFVLIGQLIVSFLKMLDYSFHHCNYSMFLCFQV